MLKLEIVPDKVFVKNIVLNKQNQPADIKVKPIMRKQIRNSSPSYVIHKLKLYITYMYIYSYALHSTYLDMETKICDPRDETIPVGCLWWV